MALQAEKFCTLHPTFDPALGDALARGRLAAFDGIQDELGLELILSAWLAPVSKHLNATGACVMRLDKDAQTLHPLIYPGLSENYVRNIAVVPVSPDKGCCGAAAFGCIPVHMDSIQEHDNWKLLQQSLFEAKLESCWSFPLLSDEDGVLGTLSFYFDHQSLPSPAVESELSHEAKRIARHLMQHWARQKKAERAMRVENRLTDRTKDLIHTNHALKRALEQRDQVRRQLVDMENMAALGTMMSSLTHEINTPIGVAITASSFLHGVQDDLRQQIDANTLTRKGLQHFCFEVAESSSIILRNLQRTNELVTTFKQLAIDQHSEEPRPVNLSQYLEEILLTLKPRLKRLSHGFCLDIDPDLTVKSHPGALSQLFINLIMNSVKHAFTSEQRGHIHIRARMQESSVGRSHLVLEYRDNGKGMDAETVESLYQPFFTQAKSEGGSGLGMHICYNLVVKLLEGQIHCESKLGKGTRFKISLPCRQVASPRNHSI